MDAYTNPSHACSSMNASIQYMYLESKREKDEKTRTSTCFFLRVRCQMRQHMFSSLELRSRVLRVATTLSQVLWRSVSSTPVTTSSTKYLVGLKCPLSL